MTNGCHNTSTYCQNGVLVPPSPPPQRRSSPRFWSPIPPERRQTDQIRAIFPHIRSAPPPPWSLPTIRTSVLSSPHDPPSPRSPGPLPWSPLRTTHTIPVRLPSPPPGPHTSPSPPPPHRRLARTRTHHTHDHARSPTIPRQTPQTTTGPGLANIPATTHHTTPDDAPRRADRGDTARPVVIRPPRASSPGRPRLRAGSTAGTGTGAGQAGHRPSSLAQERPVRKCSTRSPLRHPMTAA